MAILRSRPLVFVSSTIEELRLPRAEIEDALRSLDLVDHWLFEFHAVAAGPLPETQYLNLAENCDVFVLILGQEMSDATLEEYRRAYIDNPHKILPFYVGSSNAGIREFRRLVDSRHSRVEVDDVAELVHRVSAAVESSVLDGRLTVPALREAHRDRLTALDRLVGLDPPMSFVPYVLAPAGSERPQDVWSKATQLAITGIGGAGKTYAGLTMLDTVAADGFALPLYIRWLGSGEDIAALIAGAFNAVRFQPGQELVERYSREGRLALCIDGLDDLRSSERIDALAAIDAFAQRYPRVPIAVLARVLPDRALPSFARSEVAPLQEETIGWLFAAQGLADFRLDRDVPQRIRDLVERPFWALLLATVGLDAETGLVVLQRLIDQRLRAVVIDEARRQKLRAVLGELAFRIRPRVTVSWEQALVNVQALWDEARFASTFEAEPAETLLEEARATGLLNLEDALTFAHPLLATMLAAEAAARREEIALGDDPELASFLAALLPDERHSTLLALLAEHDVFTLARSLRLRPSMQRQVSLIEDAERYAHALHELGHLVSSEPSPPGVSLLGRDGWLAIKSTESEMVDLSADAFSDWSNSDGDGLAFVLWPENPLEVALPEFLAAGECLYRFKHIADRQLKVDVERGPQRNKEEFERLLRDRPRYAERALAFVAAWRDEVNRLAAETGLDRGSALPLPRGEPQLVLSKDGPGPPWLSYSWADQASFTFSEAARPTGPAFGADVVLREPRAEGARWLRQQAEKELGSALDSASWLRPELLAGWAW